MEKVLRNIILALAGAALLLPLFITHAVPSVTFAKAALFQIAVAAMAVPWLMLAAADRRYRPNWKNPILIALGIWFLITTILSFFSQAPERSFFSNPSRMMGVFNYAHYGLWLLILSTTLKTWLDWRRLLLWSNGVAVAVSTLAVYEYLAKGAGRAIAHMGNPIYLSVYALGSFGVAMILLTREQKLWGKILLAVSLLLHAAAVIVSGSRAATLALAATGVLWLLAQPLLARSKKMIAITATTALLLIGLGVGVAAAMPWLKSETGQKWGREHLPGSIQRMFNVEFGSERLVMWKMAGQGFLEKPWTGWGLENFQKVFDQHFDPKIKIFGERWHDRVHNQHLEFLFATGIFGTLAYLGVWITFVFMLGRWIIRRKTEHDDRQFSLAVLLFGMAYAGQNIFNFDLPMSLMLFSMVLALAIGPRPEEPDHEPIEVDSGRLVTVGFGAGVAMLIAAFVFNITPLRNAMLVTKGVQAKQYDQDLAVRYLTEAFSNNSWSNYEQRWWLSETVRSINFYLENSPSQALKTLAELAVREFEKSNQSTPNDAHVGLAASYAYRMLIRDDQTAAGKAETFARQAIAASPNYPEGYEELAEISHFMGNYEEALARFAEAEQRAFLGLDKNRIRLRMAVVYAKLGRLEDVYRQLELMNQKVYSPDKDPRLALPLALAAPDKRVNQRELDYVDRVLKNFNNHPDVIGALIILKRKAGDQQGAAADLKAFTELYPDLARKFQEQYLK